MCRFACRPPSASFFVNHDDTKPFEELVDKITANKKLNIDTSDLECEIDALVYKLYELTDEDIEFVETNTGF